MCSNRRDHQHRQLYTYVSTYELLGFAGGSVVKNPPANAGDIGSIPGSAGSSGVENGNSLQYSCMGNLMGTGAWQSMDYKRVGHDLATKQQYMNLMVTTNKNFPYIHKKIQSKSPNIDLKTVIRSQGKRAREERNREVQRQPENNKMAVSTYI